MPKGFYILDEAKHVIALDYYSEAERWCKFMESNERIVDQTKINDDVEVSTVFLGINHRFIGRGPPLLFETMIFGGKFDEDYWRYSSWDDAVTGHAAAVSKVREKLRIGEGNV